MSELRFLPWAELETSFRIGPVVITPWAEARKTVASDLQKYLDLYLSRHIRNDGSAIPHVAVLNLDGADLLADATPDQAAVFRSAVDILIFTTVVPSILANIATENASPGVPNSERFQLITQRFEGVQPYVSVMSGGTMHVWGIKKIHFCMPWHVGTSLYRHNDSMAKALGSLLTEPQSETRTRLFRALEWFRLAHTGSDETSHLSRAVMLATVFEILLEPRDRREKRLGMTGVINELIALDNLKTGTVTIGKDTVTLNAVALWFNDFYRLRNAIVHGDTVDLQQLRYPVPGRDWLTHLDVAALVIWEIVSWQLVAEGRLGADAREEAVWLAQQFGSGEPDEKFVRQVTAGLSGINVDAYHSDIG
jgi:hypothetical protein